MNHWNQSHLTEEITQTSSLFGSLAHFLFSVAHHVQLLAAVANVRHLTLGGGTGLQQQLGISEFDHLSQCTIEKSAL